MFKRRGLSSYSLCRTITSISSALPLFRSTRLFSGSTSQNKNFDVVVVGGGIVGVAAAREILKRKPNLKCGIVEKESELGFHQSSRNSGVVHAGIYYKPGSTKARLCRRGIKLSYDYFNRRDIKYKKVGKLILATEVEEIPRLMNLYERGMENNVEDLQLIEGSRIAEIEPHCVGLKALHSPQTGIVDWGLVTKYLSEDFRKMGGDIFLNYELAEMTTGSTEYRRSDPVNYPVKLVSSDNSELFAGYVLCCAGLFADRVAALSGGLIDPTILPVRGEFLELIEEKRHLVNGNIYPVPDPRYPFLGVHFTPRIDGRVLVGPNAVVAFKREGYRYSDISLSDCIQYMKHPGFKTLAMKNISFGVQEFSKSLFIRLQMRKLKKIIPQLSLKDLKKGPSGVRAQALNLNGDLVEDFVFEGDEAHSRILHCRNAPSPGATSSLAIAEVLADKMFRLMNLSTNNESK